MTELDNKTIVIRQSPFLPSNLPSGESCEECEGRLLVGQTSTHEFQGDRVIVRTENVPTLKCSGECQGTWYHPQVSLDLVKSAIPVLARYKDISFVRSLQRKTIPSLEDCVSRSTPLISRITQELT